MPPGSSIFPLEIKNASLAFRMLSLFEVMSSRGMNSRLFNECPAIAKWSETAVGWYSGYYYFFFFAFFHSGLSCVWGGGGERLLFDQLFI